MFTKLEDVIQIKKIVVIVRQNGTSKFRKQKPTKK